MKYCLVHRKTGRCIFLFSKSALLDWIEVHSYCLSPDFCSWDLHRLRTSYVPYGNCVRLFRYVHSKGVRICSLKEYIVKHKLL